MIAGGVGGYAVAKRAERSDVKQEVEGLSSIELQQAREKRMERLTRGVYIILAISLVYNILFSRTIPSLMSVIIYIAFATMFLLSFLFYDAKKSLWTKRFFLAFFISCVAYLVFDTVMFFTAKYQPASTPLVTTSEQKRSPVTPFASSSVFIDQNIGGYLVQPENIESNELSITALYTRVDSSDTVEIAVDGIPPNEQSPTPVIYAKTSQGILMKDIAGNEVVEEDGTTLVANGHTGTFKEIPFYEFDWFSGKYAISLVFESSFGMDEKNFLTAYLQKYPSDLLGGK
jgi:hypothetical protein